MSTKPVIFISYSHKDEPEKPREGELAWLTFAADHLRQLVKHDVVELFFDQHLSGGVNWRPETQAKLHACDIFLLLVSPNSMSSDEVVDKEIEVIRQREAQGEPVHFYPLLIMPVADVALEKIKDKNIRPRDLRALSSMSPADRMVHVTDVVNDIAKLAKEITERKVTTPMPAASVTLPANVHITGLPETAYERLVGRDAELKWLDEAWEDRTTNILSLVAEGGAGKSALVNEWLKRLQADNYRGAESVLGWSFYSQGTKERATSADGFLNWALEKLGVAVKAQSATAKGEAIAEALMNRRVLLVLDGVEPLQFGAEGDQGRLKDDGLRMLLKRFAAIAPSSRHGLIVLTSRLAVKDIAGRKDSSSPVRTIEKLSDEAGANLLSDNGAKGAPGELKQASADFGGHPLALALLASFLKETQNGDVRRRDHIRDLLADPKNPGHDHAARVMESYESEWLSKEPILQAVMRVMGLFDRPADAGCLDALRRAPVIAGLTDTIVGLDETAWHHAVARLRDVRLLSPADPSEPDAIDAHPLVREWFGARLKQTNEKAWKTAHGRLYEHLRDATKEGDAPSLEQLAPLYQAIAHGCCAGRHQEALDDVYVDRIYKRDADGRIVFYSRRMLGAIGSDLAALSWFFKKPYETVIDALGESDRAWVLGEVAFRLRAIGRLAEALATMGAGLQMFEAARDWQNGTIQASNLSETALLVGDISDAVKKAEKSVSLADRSSDKSWTWNSRTTLADALHAAGRLEEARAAFADAERRQSEGQPEYPLLYSLPGYQYCDLLLATVSYDAVGERAATILDWELPSDSLLDRSFARLALGRAHLGLAAGPSLSAREAAHVTRDWLDQAVAALHAAGSNNHLPRGLLARATLHRCLGDWNSTAGCLNEAEDIAAPGPMRLFLCDVALQRARAALARIEVFAPLNGMIDGSPPKPVMPSEVESASLHEEAAKQIAIAAELIATCGYHRRDVELAELQAVLNGERTFASLPIHV
jgi:hypothetical protein